MAPKVAIVIPAKNEQASIRDVILSVREVPDIDVLVVNDSSDDNTAKILQELEVKTLHHLESRGAWIATQTGLLWSFDHDYQYVVTMDADGQHLACEIPKLLEAIIAEPAIDVYVGSCKSRVSFLKKTLWKLFRTITGIKIHDITSGFRVYNRNALALLVTKNASLLEYQDVGVLLLLQSSGMTISEVSVTMNKRLDGKSRIFSSISRILYYVLSTLLISLSKKKHTKNTGDLN